jgi:hypothetical protein
VREIERRIRQLSTGFASIGLFRRLHGSTVRPMSGPKGVTFQGGIAMADATMLDVFNYMSDNKSNGYKLATFKNDWSNLTDQDKADLKAGIGDGTLTY